MLCVQIFRHIHDDAHKLVAASPAAELRDAASAEPEHFARLGAGGQLIFHFAVERGHIECVAQRRLRIGHREIAPDVEAVAFKERVRPHVDVHAQIARGTAVEPFVAAAAHIERLAVVDTGGDVHLHGGRFRFKAGAVAVIARVFDRFAASAAVGALLGGAHHAEGRALLDVDRPAAAAGFAGFGARALLAAGAAADRTGVDPVDAHGLFAALGRLLKGDRDIGRHRGALARRVGILLPSAAEAAEQVAEQVAQIECVAETAEAAERVAAAAGAEVRVHARVAVLVVARLFFAVGKHLIRLVRFLELFLGGFVAGVEVRVILLCDLAVCFFDLVVARVFAHAEHFVIISFLCHK